MVARFVWLLSLAGSLVACSSSSTNPQSSDGGAAGSAGTAAGGGGAAGTAAGGAAGSGAGSGASVSCKGVGSCGAGEACCYDSTSMPGACGNPGQCAGFPFACDSAADCAAAGKPAGFVCCAPLQGVDLVSGTCAANCNGTDYRLCDPFASGDECVSEGKTCKKLNSILPDIYFACQ